MNSIFFSPRYPTLHVPLSGELGEISFENHYYFPRDERVSEELRRRISFARQNNRSPLYEEIRKKDINETGTMNILLQRPGGIGDILFTTPIIRYLNKKGHKVDYFCHLYCWQILMYNPHVNKIYINQKTKAHENPSVLEQEGMKEFYPFLPEVLKPEILTQYDKVLSFSGVIEDNFKAESIHALDACCEWVGIDIKDITHKQPDIYIQDFEKEIVGKKLLKYKMIDPDKKTIGISPTSSSQLRSWPYYKEFINDYKDKYNIIMIHFNSKWPDKPQTWDLRESLVVSSLCDAIVAADTGFLHVAGALNIPTIALFGPFNPDYRCRYYPKCKVICHTEKVCNFCYSHPDECRLMGLKAVHPPCMAQEPFEVYKVLKEIL